MRAMLVESVELDELVLVGLELDPVVGRLAVVLNQAGLVGIERLEAVLVVDSVGARPLSFFGQLFGYFLRRAFAPHCDRGLILGEK